MQVSVTWNYDTVLNIIFLLVATTLLARFFRTGGRFTSAAARSMRRRMPPE